MNNHVNTLLNYSLLDTDDMAIRDVLTKLMADSGENSHSLATKTGVTQPTIYRIASGETREPRRKAVEKLAKFFGLSVDEMYGHTPARNAGQGATLQPAQPDPTAAALAELDRLHPAKAALFRAEIAMALHEALEKQAAAPPKIQQSA
jgi:transcriptional regulator with XRE-family HTH domain